MAYTEINFRTKKALKEAVMKGEKKIKIFNPGPFELTAGKVVLEGPHYPEAHKWYCEALIDHNMFIIPGTIK